MTRDTSPDAVHSAAREARARAIREAIRVLAERLRAAGLNRSAGRND